MLIDSHLEDIDSPSNIDNIVLAAQPRLDSSLWNKDQSLPELNNTTQTSQMNQTQDMDPFRSDPIAGPEPSGGEQFFSQDDKLSNNRKRHNNNEIPIPLLGTKFIKIAKKYSGDESQVVNSKIEKARDLILEACSLTSSRKKQTSLLDVLEVFQHYTEKGKIDNRTPKRDNVAPIGGKNMVYCDTFTPQITIDTNARDYPSLHASYAQAAAAATRTTTQPSKQQKATNNTSKITQSRAANLKPTQNPEKIITLVLNKGAILPTYNPTTIRDNLNKLLNKKAIARVHTSPRQNIVLTCMDANTEELLIKKEIWIKAFDGWPIQGTQRVNNWPKLVAHGVPTTMTLESFKTEAEEYNEQMKIQGSPRWLTDPLKKAHGSIVFSVENDEIKSKIKRNGLIVGALLIKVVNYKSSTSKTQCRKCLKYGHFATLCNRTPICAVCAGAHLTTEHSCATCKASNECSHVKVKCANCKSNTHTAFQREECEIYKALVC